ncbi:255_t:CDS:2 [Gigaspora rosea]|nr:255_t:CDS:2 [Gigaspora rosea]
MRIRLALPAECATGASYAAGDSAENMHLRFKNEIRNLVEEEFGINENFTTITVTNDRDKDLMLNDRVFYVYFLLTCKWCKVRKIRFNDVERTAAVSQMYDVHGVIVTNIGFTDKAILVAKELGVILARPDSLLPKLRFRIENVIDNIDTRILSEIIEDND